MKKSKRPLGYGNEEGFSFLEILTTLAIIAIVAALLSSAIITAREKGLQAKCINNQKNLTAAVLMFAHDNEIFPNELSLLNNDQAPPAFSDESDFAFASTIQNYYDSVSGLTQCPKVHLVNASAGVSATPVSYGINELIQDKNLSDITEPSETIVMTDSVNTATVSTVDDVEFRHVKGAIAGFADGHVEWVRFNQLSDDANGGVAFIRNGPAQEEEEPLPLPPPIQIGDDPDDADEDEDSGLGGPGESEDSEDQENEGDGEDDSEDDMDEDEDAFDDEDEDDFDNDDEGEDSDQDEDEDAFDDEDENDSDENEDEDSPDSEDSEGNDNNGHGNNEDHDDEDNPGQGGGNHGYDPEGDTEESQDGIDDDELGGGNDQGETPNNDDENEAINDNDEDDIEMDDGEDPDDELGGDDSDKGNNGVGNGVDPQPPGNPPVNDGEGTEPGDPGNKGGADPKGKK